MKMQKMMKKLGSILVLVGVVAFVQSAQAAITASPTTVDALVVGGGSASITISASGERNARTLRIGSNGSSAVQEWSNDYISARLSSTSLPNSSSVTLTLTAKKETSVAQTVDIYRTGADGVQCSVTVSKVSAPKQFAYQGVNFTTLGAVTNYIGGELVLTFAESGSMQIDKALKNASILVVGGGGAGVAGGSTTNTRYGKSGNGGNVNKKTSLSLPSGTYSVEVGAGGSSNDAKGKNSSFGGVSGFDTMTGNGATAVSGTQGSGAVGADGANAGTCDFAPNTAIKYGAGGLAQTATSSTVSGNPGDPNTGMGGQGGRNSGGAGGAGGSGVVIVRVPQQKQVIPGAPQTVYLGHTLALPAPKSAWTAKVVPGLVMVDESGDANVAPVVTAGLVEGKCTVTVESETDITTYEVTVERKRLPDQVQFMSQEGDWCSIGYAGATVVTNNNDLVFIFTNTVSGGQLDLPNNKLIRACVLAVAGGGSGGTQAMLTDDEIFDGHKGLGGGGGGAGGYAYLTNVLLTVGDYYVHVGRGGRAAVTNQYATIGQPGDDSFVTNALNNAIVSAYRGGYGGASDPIHGSSGGRGGSGGGGAWQGKIPTSGGAGMGGGGRDGQGHDGAAPADGWQNGGGGGGGAGSAGGELGDYGGGVTNDITGVATCYCRGGAGGRPGYTVYKRPDAAEVAEDGHGYGWGGDGGEGGIGGAGGDGIVVVRIYKAYENTRLEIPSVDNGGLNRDPSSTNKMSEFIWKEGVCYTSLNFNAHIWIRQKDGTYKQDNTLTYNDVLLGKPTGVVTTNCIYEADGFKNLRHYKYTLRLKDEYAWDTDTEYGTSTAMIEWRITDNFKKQDATVGVDKTVEWENGSNAVIRICSHTTPEVLPLTPNVLFIGGLCSVHGLEKQTVINSISAIARKANVDWYLFDSEEINNPASDSGYIPQQEAGYTFPWPSKLSGVSQSNHHVLGEFLKTVHDAVCKKSNGRTYNYIVLEFDGTRLGKNYGNTKHPAVGADIEADVADALKPFYTDNKVIWIVDDWGVGTSLNYSGKYPWNPTEGENRYYKPVSLNRCDSDGGQAQNQELNAQQWNALLAILDPFTHKPDYQGWTANNKITTKGYWSIPADPSEYDPDAEISYWAATRNDNQIGYTNSKKVEEKLEEVIQPVAYQLHLADNVVKAQYGLTLTGVNFSIATNDTPADATIGWIPLVEWDKVGDTNIYYKVEIPHLGKLELMTVTNGENNIQVKMSDMELETWAKLEIRVADSGQFRTSRGAEYNPATGKWEKSPNDGKARVELYDSTGQAMGVEDEAAASTLWEYYVYGITAVATNGVILLNELSSEYSKVGDKIYENFVEFGDTTPVTAFYYGNPGYELKSLKVDGKPPITEFDTTNSMRYAFGEISSKHNIWADFQPYLKPVSSEPDTYEYDGLAHVCKVNVQFVDDKPGRLCEVRYAIEEDGEYLPLAAFCTNAAARAACKDKGTHTVYYKVYAWQAGYGHGGASGEEGWTLIGADLVGSGKNDVTILPRRLDAEISSLHYETVEEAKKWKDDVKVTFDPHGTNFVDLTSYGIDEKEGLEQLSGIDTLKASFECDCSDVGVFDITFNREAVTSAHGNYRIVYNDPNVSVKWNQFEVSTILQPRTPIDPDDPDKDTGVRSVSSIYDGYGTNIIVNVTKPTENFTVKYSPTGEDGSWVLGIGDKYERPPFDFTNVCTTAAGKYSVYYLLEAEGYLSVTNHAYVEILPRPVKLVSAGRTDYYHLSPVLFTQHVDVVTWEQGFLPIADREKSAFFTDCYATLTHVGELLNGFHFGFDRMTQNWDSNVGTLVTNNYAFTCVNGNLVLKHGLMEVGGIEQPGGWGDSESSGVEDVEMVYNGYGTNIQVHVTRPTADYEIRYSTASRAELGDPSVWTDYLEITNCTMAGDEPMSIPVWYSVVDKWGNYLAITNSASVTIKPRPATVQAGSASWPYDGRAHSTNSFVCTGFVTNGLGVVEGVKAVETVGEITHVSDLPVENKIKQGDRGQWMIDPLDGTLLSNYTLEVLSGELRVTPRPLTLVSTNKSAVVGDPGSILVITDEGTDDIKGDNYVMGECFAYANGASLSCDNPGQIPASFDYGNSTTALTNDYAVTVRYGKLTVGAGYVKVGGVELTKESYEPGEGGVTNVVYVYDGKGHTVDLDIQYPDVSKLDVQFSSNGSGWTKVMPLYTNVWAEGDVIQTNLLKISFKAADGQSYSNSTIQAYVTILPRPVTVIAVSTNMTYGATPPKIDNPAAEDWFSVSNAVEETVGDVFTVCLDYKSGSDFKYLVNDSPYADEIITNGEEIVVHNGGEDVTGNYLIGFDPGALTVEPAKMTVTAPDVSLDYYYDPNTGLKNSTNVTVTVDVGPEVSVKRYRVDGGAWTNEPPVFTDVKIVAGKVEPYVVECEVSDRDGNYEKTVVTSKVTVNPRKIKVKPDEVTLYYDPMLPEDQRYPKSYKLHYWLADSGDDHPEDVHSNEVEQINLAVGGNGIEYGPSGNYLPDTTNVLTVVNQPSKYLYNYEIEYIDGIIYITSKGQILERVEGAVQMYNGMDLGITVVVTNMTDGYEISYSDSEGGPWQPTSPTRRDASSDGGWSIYYCIRDLTGKYQSISNRRCQVTILPRPVMLKAADGTWPYDGSVHRTNGFEVVNGLEGYTNFVVFADKPDEAEGILSVEMTEDSKIKDLGTTNNVIIKGSEIFKDNTKRQNYRFDYSNGVLKVEGRRPMPLIEPVDGIVTNYDGCGHMYKPKFNWENDVVPGDLKISYSLSEDGDYAEYFCLTNVYEGGAPQVVYFRATSDSYLPTNGFATVTIRQRVAKVSVDPALETKVYDGTPLTNWNYKVENFVDIPGRKEGVKSVELNGSVTDVEDEPTTNVFTKIEYNEFTDLSNYVIITNNGSLKVTPANLVDAIVIQGATNTVAYSGFEQLTNGWWIVDKDKLPEPFNTDWVAITNGNAATVRGTNVNANVYKMGLTDACFACTNANYTNVTFTVNDGWLKIDPKLVTITAKNAEKAMGEDDPPDLLVPEIKGLIGTDTVSYEVIRAPGEAAGTYDIIVTADEYQGNYKVNTEDGTLTIVDRDIEVKAESIVYIYNGTATNPVVTVMNSTVKEDTVKIEYLWDDGEWRPEAPTFRDVIPTYDNRTNVMFRVQAEDEKGALIPTTNYLVVAIQPRPITLKMGNGNHQDQAKQKPYDGTPLWGEASDIQVGGLGYVPGEEFAYGWFTNRIEVGVNPSSFDWHDNSNKTTHVVTKVSNYVVTPEYGWLRILPAENAITVYSESALWEFDGKTHPCDAAETNKYHRWWAEYGVPLAPGDGLKVELDGATLSKKGLAFNAFKSIAVTNATGDVTAHYRINPVPGMFEMKNAQLDEFDLIAKGYVGIYDGQPTNVMVQVTNELAIANNAKVYYSLDKLNWSETLSPYVNVTGGVIPIWYKATAENFEDYAPKVPVTIEIKPRPVEFESLDIIAKAGDGVTIPDASVDARKLVVITNGAYGVVAGDEFTFDPTNTLSEVGYGDAAFRWVASEEVAKNYAVTLKYGQLILTDPDALTVLAGSTNFVFNGSFQTHEVCKVVGAMDGDEDLEVTGSFLAESCLRLPTKEGAFQPNVVTSVVYAGAQHVYAATNFIPGKLTMSPKTFTDVTVVTTNVIYDGGSYFAEAKTSVAGATISYNATGKDGRYSVGKLKFVNANANGYPVYYKVSAEGYEPYYGVTAVVIRQRPITILSLSVTNEYSGVGLTTYGAAGAVWVAKGEGLFDLVNGDRLDLDETFTPISVTNAIASPNTFVYAIKNNADEDVSANYYVTPIPGMLTVNPVKVTAKVTVKDKVYDGKDVAVYESVDFGELPTDGGQKKSGVLTLDPKVVGGDDPAMKFFFDTPDVGVSKPVTNNLFKAEWAITNMVGVLRSNYAVDVKVNPAKITPADMPDPETPRQPGDRRNPDAGPEDGPNLPDEGRTPPIPGDGGYEFLSDYDIVTNYDGEAHTFNTNLLFETLAQIANTNGYFDADYKVEYSLTGAESTWTNEPYAWANVAGTPTSFWYRVTAGPNQKSKIHAVGVTVTQRVVQVTSGTEEFKYDGNAHSNVEVKVTAGSFAPGEGISTNGFATITNVGTNENSFVCSWNDGVDPANYAFSVVTGKISVVAKYAGDGTDIEDVGPFVYKGSGWEPTPMVTDTNINQQVTTLTYSWAENTNACEDAAMVIMTFYGNYTGVLTNYFSISKRPVTVVAMSDTWTYNGEVHETNGVFALTAEVTGDDTGFVMRDGVMEGIEPNATMTAASRIVDVGTSNNVIEVGSLSPTGNTNLERDYDVSYSNGTLTVTLAPPPPLDPPPSEGPAFPDAAGPHLGPNPDLPPCPPSPRDEMGDVLRLSNYDTVTVYDGKGHTFDYASLTNSIATNEWLHGEYSVTYSLDGVNWTEVGDDPYEFTNVVSTSFWYQVTAPFAHANYSNYIHAVGVTVTQRVAQVTAGSVEWPYDGREHSTNLFFTVDFADGEGVSNVTMTAESVIVDVGTNDNVIASFVVSNGTDLANYTVVTNMGRLVVKARKVDDDLIDFGKLGPFVYNGNGQTPDPAVTNTELGVGLQKGRDYTCAWADNTNACEDAAMVIVTFKGNYTGVLTNYFSISRRPVTVIWEANDKVFDNTTDATLKETFTFSNKISDDELALATNGITVAFVDETIGSNKEVDYISGFYPANVTGADKDNYICTFAPSATATITSGTIAPWNPNNPDTPEPPMDQAWVGASNVVTVYQEDAGTNVIVRWGNLLPEDVKPTSVLYSTNGISGWFADDDHIAFTNVFYDADHYVTSQRVWFVVSVPNYAPVTNSAWVLIREKESDVVTHGVDAVTVGIEQVVEEDLATFGPHDFVKVQLQLYAMDYLDHSGDSQKTRMSWETAQERAAVLIDKAEADGPRALGRRVSKAEFFDLELERTYDARIANKAAADYDYREWDDIGDATHDYHEVENVCDRTHFKRDSLILVCVPFTIPADNDFVGIYRSHRRCREYREEHGSVWFEDRLMRIDEAGVDPDKDEHYEIEEVSVEADGSRKVNVMMLVRDFSLYSFICMPSSQDALFTGTLKWVYCHGTGSYFAQLSVSNTNGLNLINYDAGSLRFCFADRVDADGQLMVGLWNTRKNGPADEWINPDGDVYRSFDLDTPERPIDWKAGMTVYYGPQQTAEEGIVDPADRVGTPEMYVRRRVNPKSGNEELADMTSTDFAGYLVWTVRGEICSYPVKMVANDGISHGEEGNGDESAGITIPAVDEASLRTLDKKADKGLLKSLKGNVSGYAFAADEETITADVSLKLATTGKWTGTLVAGGVKTKLSGVIKVDKNGTTVLDTTKSPSLRLVWNREFWVGEYGGGLIIAKVPPKTVAAALVGTWNCAVGNGVQGGYFRAKATAKGKVTVTGKLLNSVSLSVSGQLLEVNGVSYMHGSKKVKGQTVDVTLALDGNSVAGRCMYGDMPFEVQGGLLWSKSISLLGLDQRQLTMPDISATVTAVSAKKVSVDKGDSNLKLSVTASTGVFKGSYKDASGKTCKYEGILLSGNDGLVGFGGGSGSGRTFLVEIK